MTPSAYVLSIVASAVMLLVVIEMLRRGRLRERHAVWWFVAGVLALIASVFPAILLGVSALLGIEVPANLVFFVAIAVLFLVCIQHSAELTRLESQNRTLAEHVAILDTRLREREHADGAVGGPPPGPARGDET